MELFSCNILGNKNHDKKFLIFQETETQQKFLISRETEPFSPPRENSLYFRKRKPRKKSLYSRKQKPRKNPYTSRDGTFLYLRKRNFLVFWERYIQNPDILKTCCISRTISNIYDGTLCKKPAQSSLL